MCPPVDEEVQNGTGGHTNGQVNGAPNGVTNGNGCERVSRATICTLLTSMYST